ncbi:hypothetical protein Y032_0360g3449 [Ancylostoma ceylanicum]|uniref:Uncharacterized protein n=1 Tax=Ancylostoma ceylanicum TaxID=53326 RepID=A0A016RWT2_9BILA|nr:hypothetical protein Y032_0360g3449 [Ancylostoma ceylanicum]
MTYAVGCLVLAHVTAKSLFDIIMMTRERDPQTRDERMGCFQALPPLDLCLTSSAALSFRIDGMSTTL